MAEGIVTCWDAVEGTKVGGGVEFVGDIRHWSDWAKRKKYIAVVIQLGKL